MSLKEILKIIFDESREKTNEEHAMTVKVIAFTLYPLGVIVSFAMIWFLARDMMNFYYWFFWLVVAVLIPGFGLYKIYRKAKQSKNK